jgi:hypothetical protein
MLTSQKWEFLLIFKMLQNKFTNPLWETAIQNEQRNENLNVKPVIPDDIFEMKTVLKWVLCLYFSSLNVKYTKSYETEIQKGFRKINLYINNGISNCVIWSIDTRKMSFLTLFHFDTRLLTFKHPKLIST